MRNTIRNIPARTLLRGLAAGAAAMALVAVGGTAAAASGVLTAAPGTPSQGSSPSGSSAPSGSASPDRDHDRRGRHYSNWDHDRDGDDGSDGKDGKDGRTVYVHDYVTRYLDNGGDSSRVNSGGQVALYPSGGVATGGE